MLSRSMIPFSHLSIQRFCDKGLPEAPFFVAIGLWLYGYSYRDPPPPPPRPLYIGTAPFPPPRPLPAGQKHPTRMPPMLLLVISSRFPHLSLPLRRPYCSSTGTVVHGQSSFLRFFHDQCWRNIVVLSSRVSIFSRGESSSICLSTTSDVRNY